ncbi:hypothetical protein J7624_09755 [Wohlfahrtiimonas chitiniclastica]|uniref:hypothetical protein n=1 Tax=Wohlfahrtiimonas chitiniclastica TaxID=400946 RepID=UPI001BD03514|nr:hypothetical protein [Wohlfahrtiimonas chitiniclastica]MBS7827427.1 hypothetical protein [Wohlfahrtiimonas chitiniclastica]
MKLLTSKQVQHSLIRSKKILRRKARKKLGKKRYIRPVRVFSRVRVIAPKILDLFNEENYKTFILFITKIRDHINHGERVIIDFRDTEILKACAVTVLYASIDFMQRLTKDNNVIIITKCKSASANYWFRMCGLWRLTGYHIDLTGVNNNLEIVSAVAGTTVGNNDSDQARSKIKDVLTYIKNTIYDGQISQDEGMKLYAALTESISNVGLHAYSFEEKYSEFIADVGKRWWILAHKIDEQLFLMVYDMGEGIPLTLVRRDMFTVIQQIFNPKTDSDKISAAVRYGETRMKSIKHGKGLTDMKKYVIDNPKGALHIFSGMGRYSYKSETKNEVKVNLPYSIGGTLIQWNVSLRNRG